MMQESMSRNKAVGGGLELQLNSGVALKITPSADGALDLNDWKVLIRYQEYLSNDYCLACAYFKVVKGHFGTCPDLPHVKPFDGTKKGSGCGVWRLKTIYLQYGIKQKLPETPALRRIKLIVAHRKSVGFKTQWRNYSNPDIKKPWFWHWKLPQFAYDFLLNPEPLPEKLDLKVWNNKAKKPVFLTCLHCGEKFELTPMSGAKFCSRKCANQHHWANRPRKPARIKHPRKATRKKEHKFFQGDGWSVTSNKINGLLHWNNIPDGITIAPIQKGRCLNNPSINTKNKQCRL